MKSMIIEVCFVEATEDVALYQRLGADTIGKNIAESITNKKIVEVVTPSTTPSNQGETYYRVIAGSFKDRTIAEKRKTELEAKGFTGVFLEVIKK